MVADTAPLLHRRKAAHHYMVANLGMSSKRGVVRKNDMVADNAVMRHVRGDKEHAMVADTRLHGIDGGTRVHGDMFADGAMMANLEGRWLAGETRMLRRMAKNGKGKHFAVGPKACAPFDDHMRVQMNPVAKRDVGADHAERTDKYILAKRGFLTDDRGRMDGHRHDTGSFTGKTGISVAGRRSSRRTRLRMYAYHRRWRPP